MRAADQGPDEGRCQIVIIGVDPLQACKNSFASNLCFPAFATVEFARYADTAEDNSLSSVERVRSKSSERGATKVLVRFDAAMRIGRVELCGRESQILCNDPE
jgi:hypothetical protein